MPPIRKQIREMMNEMDAPPARVRPGSVLVLVIVLLVLMALLGTAYLVTARNERVATRLYSHNVQIDMLVQGVENMAMAALTDTSYQKSDVQHYDDWYTTSSTPMPTGTTGTSVDHSWLAARYPETLINTLGTVDGQTLYPIPKGIMVISGGQVYQSLVDNNTSTPPGGNWVAISGFSSVSAPTWTAISAPLAVRTYFEDPRYPAVNVRPDGVRTIVSPSWITLGGKNYPALKYYSTVNNTYETALAASATGNGIADSFLWRLPIGTIDGITYYAAVRIIDNNSAVNVNCANSSSVDFTSTGAPLANPGLLPGIFPGGIGLGELTYTYSLAGTPQVTSDTIPSLAELLALNNFRFNGTPGQKPSGIAGGGTSVINDNFSTRTDFNYLSVDDALFMGLSRRINNPGVSNGSAPFQSFTWADAAALAYRGDLPNPNASPSNIEQALAPSTWNHAIAAGPGSAGSKPGLQSTPWDPSQVTNWFQQYVEGSAQLNRRLYLTPHNPLSNLMPTHAPFTAQNTWLPAAGLTTISNYMIPVSPTAGVKYATGIAPRVSLNTADVSLNDLDKTTGLSKGPTLWFGFYNAMMDVLPGNSANSTNNVEQIPQGIGQFRSSIRDMNGFQSNYTSATTYFTGPEMVLLRSLLAAVNAKDLRDSGDNVEPSGLIAGFPITVLNNPTTCNLYAYGTERQVFITEVYVNTEVNAPQTLGIAQKMDPNAGKTNPKGYFAVELYNPYDYPIDLSWWTLLIVSRSAPGAGAQTVTGAPISKFNGFAATGDPQNPMLPAHSYMILENMPPQGVTGVSANDAQYIPSNVSIPTGALQYYIPNLHEVLANSVNGKPGELVLLRQINAKGKNPPNSTDPSNLGTAMIATLQSMPPVDSFDFTGMQLSDGKQGSKLNSYHYVRANPGGNAGTPTTAWRFVYPGRWDPTAYAPYYQEGVESTQWIAPDPMVNPVPAGQFDPWVDTPPSSISGQPTPIALGTADANPSYVNNFPAIQLNNTDMGGPNKMFSTMPAFQFPFGGFARVGDVLQTPFIGAYLVLDSTGTQILEINSVTRDCATADDWDNSSPTNLNITTSDDSIEQVGRFCPLLAVEQAVTLTSPTSSPPTPPIEGIIPVGGYDPYAWAAHVMDYFTTIQNPNDDYLPNVDPTAYLLAPWNMSQLTYSNAGNVALPVANLVNSGTGPNKGAEDLIPVEGQINLNTANWRALATVPWVATTSPTASADNIQIAKAIVSFRNTYGPFKTLFDLNKVPLLLTVPATSPVSTGAFTFQTYYGNPKTSDYGAIAGDISPLWLTSTAPAPQFNTDNVTNDFETRLGTITRVSNLLTTRSDTFTVYVLVQGWSGVGTANPSLIVQRRAAFIADRSQMTSGNTALNITPVQAY